MISRALGFPLEQFSKTSAKEILAAWLEHEVSFANFVQSYGVDDYFEWVSPECFDRFSENLDNLGEDISTQIDRTKDVVSDQIAEDLDIPGWFEP